ncbi:hypothetical protein WJX77_007691 [Trebouxia sp. C0004]
MSAGGQLRLADGATQEATARPAAELTTAIPGPAAIEVTEDTLQYTDMHSNLSDDVYKRSRLLRVRACLPPHLWAGWNESSDAQKQAHWQEHYKQFYPTNSCGKETTADEVLCLYETWCLTQRTGEVTAITS